MGGAVCPVSMRTTSPSSISSAKHGERRLPGTRSTGGAMGGGECPVTHRRTSQGGTCPIVGHTVQGTATLRRRANHMLLNSEGSNGSDVRDVASTETAGDGSQNEQSAGDVAHVSFAPSTAVPTTARVPDIAHILQASPGAIVCTDAIGTILYANPAFTALTGYTVEEALGKNVTILQPEDLAERHDDIMRRVVDGGTPRVIGKAGRQLAVIPKSGEDRPMLLALGRLDVADTTYFVADIADISQDVKGNDGEQHEEEEESQGRSNLLRWLRVCGALLLVALLQCLNVYNGGTSMVAIAQRASEFTYASRLKALSSLLTCVPSCVTASWCVVSLTTECADADTHAVKLPSGTVSCGRQQKPGRSCESIWKNSVLSVLACATAMRTVGWWVLWEGIRANMLSNSTPSPSTG